MSYRGQHILSTKEFDLERLHQLFSVADSMIPYAKRKKSTHVLDGAVLSNLFFEPSTRTRLSFGTAFNLLGGDVQDCASDNSSLTKGESIADTARVISGYSDIICMRHWQNGSVANFAEYSSVPVINGGDGTNEHPTQALLDLYTLQRELASLGKSIDGVKIAMVGDLKLGRTIHSLCRLLCLYKNVHLILISSSNLALPTTVRDELDRANHQIVEAKSLEQGISDVDVIYSTRVQRERFSYIDRIKNRHNKLRINQQIYDKYCQPNTIIMHPLPRDSSKAANELDVDLDNNDYLSMFRQAQNGLLIRMALFALVLGVDDQLADYEKPVNWYVNPK